MTGFKRLQKDINQMIGVNVGIYWRATWQVITPLVLVVCYNIIIMLLRRPCLS